MWLQTLDNPLFYSSVTVGAPILAVLLSFIGFKLVVWIARIRQHSVIERFFVDSFNMRIKEEKINDTELPLILLQGGELYMRDYYKYLLIILRCYYAYAITLLEDASTDSFLNNYSKLRRIKKIKKISRLYNENRDVLDFLYESELPIGVEIMGGYHLVGDHKFRLNKPAHPLLHSILNEEAFRKYIKLLLIREKNKRVPLHYIYCTHTGEGLGEDPHVETITTPLWPFVLDANQHEELLEYRSRVKLKYRAQYINGSMDLQEFKSVFVQRFKYMLLRMIHFGELTESIREHERLTKIDFKNWYAGSKNLFCLGA